MMNDLLCASIALQACMATMLTWLLTSMGALAVFFFRRRHQTMLNAMLAAGGGVMLASSFWSLLSPAQRLAEQQQQPIWLVCFLGFLCGGLLLMLGEQWIEQHRRAASSDKDRRRRMLITAITLHNIPEGMAVGVAFGAALNQQDLLAAWMLAIGIGLQNIPEGAAVSLPLHRDGFSRPRAALWGMLSGFVEPIASLLGVLIASTIQSIMPFMLSFAAGAMILVVVSDLIPESQRCDQPQLMTIATLLGFSVMMLLDVMLG